MTQRAAATLRDARWVLMAAALHGALVLVLWVTAPSSLLTKHTPLRAPVEAEIEVLVLTDREAARELPPRRTKTHPRPSGASSPGRSGALPLGVTVGGNHLETSATPPEPLALDVAPFELDVAPLSRLPAGEGGKVEAEGAKDFDEPPLLTLPGIGAPVWAQPGLMPADPAKSGPAPTAVARRPRDREAAARELRRTLRQRDARWGLDFPSGPVVVDAVRAATRLHTPPVSYASFQVRVDSRGQVQDLRVLSHSGPRQPWDRVVLAARRALAGRRLTIPSDFRSSGAAGALLTVHVQSDLQLPSGSGRRPTKRKKVPTERPRWPYTPPPPPEGYSARTPPWGPPPGPGHPDVIMVPDPNTGEQTAMAAVGFAFDVSDIGAHPQRVDTAWITAAPLNPPPASSTPHARQ